MAAAGTGVVACNCIRPLIFQVMAAAVSGSGWWWWLGVGGGGGGGACPQEADEGVVDYGVDRGRGWLVRSRRVFPATAIAGTGLVVALAAVSAVGAACVWTAVMVAATTGTEAQARKGAVGADGAVATDAKKAYPAACRPSTVAAL